MSADETTSTVDLRRFNQVFFEECAEHLAEMEHILLSLDAAGPDHEQMNAIFRAAHSIKGGAGIFGFEDMTVVTHLMESLLDRLRNNELSFRIDLVDLLLEAGDVISMQLAGHREGAEVRQEAIDRISLMLRQWSEPEQTEADGNTSKVETHSVPCAGPERYELVFTPDPDIFTRGVRLDNIIAELADLAEPGEFESRAELAEVPELEQYDPESCLTRWHFTFTSSATVEQISEVFLFVAEEEQLDIRRLQPEAPPHRQGARDTRPGEAPPCPLTGDARPSECGTVPAVPQGAPRTPDREEPVADAVPRRVTDHENTIRVGVTKVDQLINQVGELLITQAMLVQAAAALDPVQFEALHRSVAQLERNSRDLQGSVMSIRLVPISVVFNRFPRMVRELAARLDKSIELKLVGGETELDKGMIERLADPLSHLVRNAMDHGLETGAARVARGKSPTGTIRLRASQVGGRILIEVSDDGAGLDRARILAKAAEKGIACSEAMSDEEVWQLIFTPGFSTAQAVTDLSGRGVGMDVVLKNVQAIGGRVQIASQAGHGSCVTISLLLTLAIQNGLSVSVGNERFIVPLNSITESLQPQGEQLKTVNGNQVVTVRGDYLPIIRLHDIFEIDQAVREPRQGILVLVEAEGHRGALLVDRLLDELQVVVKSIETNFRRVEGSAGATILGDGRVALILDVAELFALHRRRHRAAQDDSKEAA